MIVFTFLYMVLLIAFSLFFGGKFAYFVGINVITFILMGYDKFSAIRHKSRLPERFLLTMCALGGSVGCILAIFMFRHKTKKLSFNLPATGIFLIQLFLVIIFLRIQ